MSKPLEISFDPQYFKKENTAFKEKAENIVDSIIMPFFREQKKQYQEFENKIKSALNDQEKEIIIKKFSKRNHIIKNNTLLIKGPQGSGKTRLIYEIKKYLTEEVSFSIGNSNESQDNFIETLEKILTRKYKELAKLADKYILKNIDKGFKIIDSKKETTKNNPKNNLPDKKNDATVAVYDVANFGFYDNNYVKYYVNFLLNIYEKLGGHSTSDDILKFIDKNLIKSIDGSINKVTGEKLNLLEKIKSILFSATASKPGLPGDYSKITRVNRYINFAKWEKPLVVIIEGLDKLKSVALENFFYILNNMITDLPNIFFIVSCNYDYVTTSLNLQSAANDNMGLFNITINTKYWFEPNELISNKNQFINRLILTTTKVNLLIEPSLNSNSEKQAAFLANINKVENAKISKEYLQFILFFLGYLKYNYEDWYIRMLKLSECDTKIIDKLEIKMLSIWDKLDLKNQLIVTQRSITEGITITNEIIEKEIVKSLLSDFLTASSDNKIVIKTEFNNYVSLFYFYLLVLADECELTREDYSIQRIYTKDSSYFEVTIKKDFLLKKPNFIQSNPAFYTVLTDLIGEQAKNLNLSFLQLLMQKSIYSL